MIASKSVFRQIGIVTYTYIHTYTKTHKQQVLKMDVLPSGNIFHELQVVHDTGYYDGKVSPEEHWQQVGHYLILFLKITKTSNISITSYQ